MRRGVLRAVAPQKGVVFEPPVSKSDAIRLLFVQHARGDRLESFGSRAPDDVRIGAKTFAQLQGASGEIELSMGLGAAPFRFALALAAVEPGRVVRIDAEPGLRCRPHGRLVESLCATLGAHGLRLKASGWPVTVDTRELKLPRKLSFGVKPESSQFVSALLLAGARLVAGGACSEVSVILDGEPASAGYLDLTIEWLMLAGFDIEEKPGSLRIAGYSPREIVKKVPPDWSSAAYLAVWAWRCGSGVHVDARRAHPDSSIVTALENAGVSVGIDGHSILRLEGELKSGLSADALQCPDLIPTLAVIALAAPGVSEFRNVGVLRTKESDRLEFIEQIVASAGGTTKLSGENLVLEPPERLASRVRIETRSDHRRALAGSLLTALGCAEVALDDIDCVAKSFPAYWDEISRCAELERD